ncbi:phosphohistidine phosphatase SixA [Massilia glaciei]|uniref:Phosphohistidine phosphatase SixA n=1 Tax=Massilia glaciei TaxID=1524097 RepID=A0A2U2HM70_9BURK|nr:phosphohistidine phosphatase SixA [Massilia glaciei]PWF48600.1 phosphohistidine phosphatase SixA [Massilia glaciei]
MDLILLRHAEADFGEPDLQRPLTAKGHKQARRMGEWLNSQLPESCRILVSPALRAVQTAEGLGRKFKIHPGLAPGAGCEQVLQVANWPSNKDPVLIVGHQPTLGQVAALLLSGAPQYWNMKQANAWWFVQREPQDPEGLSLRAVMSPELV